MKSSLLLPLLLPVVAALPAAPEARHVQPVTRALHSERHLAKRDININAILAKIVDLFPVNVVVTKISNLITIGEVALATLFNIDTTEDDLSSSKCADITIIFSRGTTETGNVGALVGPPFFDTLETKLGGAATVAIQGVDYPADVPGFLEGGDPKGSQTMANLVSSAISKCPKTKLVMSGYSQGGQLVHNAAKLLSSKITAAVSSVVIFGDPDKGQAVKGVSADKTLVICHDGDNICDGGSLILLPHLTYAEDAEQAANFVAAKAGF